jgi:hypothetical protein
VAGDVDARRIDDGAEVYERDLVQPVRVVVLVECAPAAVSRLHSLDPVAGTRDGGPAGPELVEGDRDHRCVVDVRVEVVVVLERPAPGLHAWELHRPVAASPDLLPEEPLRSLVESRLVGGHSCGPQGDQREAGVPDG